MLCGVMFGWRLLQHLFHVTVFYQVHWQLCYPAPPPHLSLQSVAAQSAFGAGDLVSWPLVDPLLTLGMVVFGLPRFSRCHWCVAAQSRHCQGPPLALWV